MEDKDILNAISTMSEEEICELLNYANIENIEETKLTNIEKKRVEKITLSKLGKKSKGNFKRVIQVAGIAMVLFIGVSIANPAFAKSIPLVGDTIKYFERNIGSFDSEFSKYAENLDLTATDSNIDINLNSVVYDGDSLYLAYKLTKIPPLECSGDYGINIRNTDLIINGDTIKGTQKVEVKGTKGFENNIYTTEENKVEYKDGNQTYLAVTKWDLSNYKIKDKVNIQWNINNIQGIDGKWEFKFSASKEQLMSKSKKFEKIGQISFNDYSKFDIDKFKFNPLETTIEYTSSLNNEKFDKLIKSKNIQGKDEIAGLKSDATDLTNGKIFLTDTGEQLIPHDGNGYLVPDDEQEIMKMHWRFYAVSTIPSEIKIVSRIKTYSKKDKFKIYKFIKIKDLKAGMELSQGKDKSIIINSLERQDKKLKMNISFKGIDKEPRQYIALITDKDKYLNTDFEKQEATVDIMKLSKVQYEKKTYNLKTNEDIVFDEAQDDNYLMYIDYDSAYTLDMENAKVIKLK